MAWALHKRLPWSKSHAEPVRFVYLTVSATRAAELHKLGGPGFEMAGHSGTAVEGLDLAAAGGARLMVTDAALDGATWRDILATCDSVQPRMPVVVILDEFDGSLWVEIIRAGAFDVVARPLNPEAFRRVLAEAAGVG